jgi:hypothetical protein
LLLVAVYFKSLLRRLVDNCLRLLQPTTHSALAPHQRRTRKPPPPRQIQASDKLS